MGQRRTSKCGSVMSLAGVIAMPRRNAGDGVTRERIICHCPIQVFLKASQWLVIKYSVGSTLQGFHANRTLSCKLIRVLLAFFICVGVVGMKVILLRIRPSVRLHQLFSHWKDFCENLYWSLTLKSFEKIHNFFLIGQKYGALHIKNEVLFKCNDECCCHQVLIFKRCGIIFVI